MFYVFAGVMVLVASVCWILLFWQFGSRKMGSVRWINLTILTLNLGVTVFTSLSAASQYASSEALSTGGRWNQAFSVALPMEFMRTTIALATIGFLCCMIASYRTLSEENKPNE